MSETGKYAREGKDTRQGYNTWLSWVNDEYGGIKVGDECYLVEIVLFFPEGIMGTLGDRSGTSFGRIWARYSGGEPRDAYSDTNTESQS